MIITEEVFGYYHYHISDSKHFTKPICGKDIITMPTSIPFNSWESKSDHFYIKEKYCKKCKEMYDKISTEDKGENNG